VPDGEVPPPCPPDLLDAAVAMTRQAGELTLRWFRDEELVVDTKHDDTPVTEADRAAEHLLRDEIRRHHPEDAVLGEEHGHLEGGSGRRWIIDPIDGTKAFTHGVPLYTNLLACYDEHGPLLGVINLPALDEVVYAGRGIGCWFDGHPCRVSDRSEVRGAYVTSSGLSNWPIEAFDAARAAGVNVRTWGDGYGYALVATGRAEAMVDHEANEWDLAPMPVILAEAGGRMSDLDGGDRIDAGSGLGTNAHLHDELLAILTTGR